MQIKLSACIKDGKLKLYDRKVLEDFISKNEGDVWIEIRNAPITRSPEQNGYYRTIIRKAAKDMGYTTNELHLQLKEMFNVESTKELTVGQFSEYLDLVIRVLSEMGHPPRDPRRFTNTL